MKGRSDQRRSPPPCPHWPGAAATGQRLCPQTCARLAEESDLGRGVVIALRLLYCEARYPDSGADQDRLFEELCSGAVGVSVEEMERTIVEFRNSGRLPRAPAPTLSRVQGAD
jgi:hypothetical protein